MPIRSIQNVGLLFSVASLITVSSPAIAEQDQPAQYSIPAQPLSRSLDEISRRSGVSIVAPAELVRDVTAPALEGIYTLREVVALLLEPAGLTASLENGTLIVTQRRSPKVEPETITQSDVVVTGTRIRNAPVASPVIRIDSATIRDSGYAELGDVARSIPQSFGGGQNPGVGFNVPASTGGNVGGGSSFNLRGLGSDATLTILNGRRLPYDSARQGIDISAIPLAALDRIEVVADGSSALYGSDAVGGVVNVILKRDYDGVETRARFGRSSDGGNFQQQYSALVGNRWREGGGFVTYEFSDASAITADQRSFAEARPGLTLLPASRRHAVAASAHQRLDDHSVAQLDLLYNQRSSKTTYPLNFAGNLALSRTTQSFDADSFAIGGSITRALREWQIETSGSYGTSRTEFTGRTFTNGVPGSANGGRYDNRSWSGELSANGPLATVPGGPLKVAFGTGFRRNEFRLFRGAGALQNINANHEVLYGFAELSAPLVSPDMNIPLIHRINISGAIRHEQYRQIASVATPKFGLIYSPTPFIDVKASWGRSFRAPSFIQQYQVSQALLYPATVFGGSSTPPGATALLVVGGNDALQPETARSWSLSIAVEPPGIPGLSAELGYASTNYINRIVSPIPFLSQALSNPAYRDQVTTAPPSDLLTTEIARADQFLNLTGAQYDPSRVIALISGANVNAGRQTTRSVDALIGYRRDLNSKSIELTLNATYIESDQQLSPNHPVLQLAGRLFNPPHWRARTMARWNSGPTALSATLSHVGGVTDTRQPVPVDIAGMTTLDLTARYRVENRHRLLDGLEFTLTALNLFNATPDRIATTVYYDAPYDSTNYSPVGRFVAIGFSRKW